MKELKKLAKDVFLKKEEKEQIKNNLISFMQDHPVRNVEEYSHIYQPALFLKKLTLKPMPLIITLITVLLLGGGAGISAAAESSMPNSLLYPVKVGINEEVRGFFTFSPEKKAEWEARRMERRLEEAEKLFLENKLDKSKEQKIQEKFTERMDRLDEKMAEFKEKDNLQAQTNLASRIETSLQVHQKILDKLNKDKSKNSPLSSVLKEKIEKLSKNQELLEKELKSETQFKMAAEGKLGALENKIKEVKRFLEKHKNRMSAESLKKTQEQIGEVKKKLEEGRKKLEEGKYREAFLLFQDAHRLAGAIKVSTTALIDLDVKVDLKIDLNDLKRGGRK